MIDTIQLGDISVSVVRKNVKNIHLSVYPPAGVVRIAAPTRMELETIRLFAIAKLGWIREQQRRFQLQERETPRELLERESHYVWGGRYLMVIEEKDAVPKVELRLKKLWLQVRPGTSEAGRKEVLDEWYRDQLKNSVPPLIAKWEKRLGVKVEGFQVRKMKTMWGSCSPGRGTIRINLDLAKKPRTCLEYIVVHELVHLLEPTHNANFVALMNHHYPQWRTHRTTLNRLPLKHERWGY